MGRILIRDLGLEGKATPKQFAKKWENLKMKYKVSLKVYSIMVFLYYVLKG